MLTGATSTVCFSLEGAFFSSKWMLDAFFGGWDPCGEEDRDSFGSFSTTFFFGIFASACSSFWTRRIAFFAAFSTAGSESSSLVNFSLGARFAMIHHPDSVQWQIPGLHEHLAYHLLAIGGEQGLDTLVTISHEVTLNEQPLS